MKDLLVICDAETVWSDFFRKVEREFVPADSQERLREDTNNTNERGCKDLSDNVGKFCHVVTRVRDMSELVEIRYFPTRTYCSLAKGCSLPSLHNAVRSYYCCVGL